MNKPRQLSLEFAWQLYVISDSVKTLVKAVNDGAKIIQLRDKSADHDLILAKAVEIAAYKRNHDFIFIINDDAQLAKEAGADGVHIGQDTSPEETRKIVGPDRLIGRSTHSLEQGLAAHQEGVDYLSVGPVFLTPTKPDCSPVGLAYVRSATQRFSLPWVAIGGINSGNIDEILTAGARTIGVVRAAAEVPLLLSSVQRRRSN